MSVASDKLANVSARSSFEGLKSGLSSAIDDLKLEFSNSVVAAESVAPVAAPPAPPVSQ